jgi:hypothetical protein
LNEEKGTVKMHAAKKQELFAKALQDGIINDPRWQELLDEPMPVWAVLELALNLVQKLDPPRNSYD